MQHSEASNDCAGVVSADVFLSTLTAAVGTARSTKAQTAAIETFTAVAPLLRNIGPAALRCTCLLSVTLILVRYKSSRAVALSK